MRLISRSARTPRTKLSSRLAVIVTVLLGLLVPAQVALAACGSVWSDSLTTSSNFTAEGPNGDVYAVFGYWSSTHTTPASGTCVDINFRNDSRPPNFYPDGRGAYRDTGGTWHHGEAGWVSAPLGQYVVVVSNIANGRKYKVAADQSMSVTVAA